MVREVRSHDDDEDTDFGIMNSAVSTESMDMAEEVLINHSFIPLIAYFCLIVWSNGILDD